MRRLASELPAFSEVTLPFNVETNAVFAQLPDGLAAALNARGWRFYEFAAAAAWRFMCTWNTTMEAIQALIGNVRQILTESTACAGESDAKTARATAGRRGDPNVDASASGTKGINDREVCAFGRCRTGNRAYRIRALSA